MPFDVAREQAHEQMRAHPAFLAMTDGPYPHFEPLQRPEPALHICCIPRYFVRRDEISSFVYAKENHVPTAKAAPERAGDVWTWVAVCANTKPVPCWHVGAGTEVMPSSACKRANQDVVALGASVWWRVVGVMPESGGHRVVCEP